MSGLEIARSFRANLAHKSTSTGGGAMNAAVATVTTSDYNERFSALLRERYGDSRSAAKTIASLCRAGVGTAKKWLEGVNGADAVNLINLMAHDEEVFRLVCELAGRADVADRTRAVAALLEAKRLLQGVELP